MSHLVLMPVLVPLLTGALLLVLEPLGPRTMRTLSVLAMLGMVPTSVALLVLAAGDVPVAYFLGDWPAPFGIVLVLDRLSALMLGLSALLGLAATVYACAGSGGDVDGPQDSARLHAMLHFLLLGVNGAFLTGDLFNLFVCFEILLIASYGLLMHGGGAARTRASLHVVALNLVGSAVFLVAIGCVYAATGSLNLADITSKVPGEVAEGSASAGLLRAGALLLLAVFALKAAALPLGFWLPRAYGYSLAPVACAFALMTKVGVYAIVRVHGQALDVGVAAGVVTPWLLPLGLATVVVGTIGALGARHLNVMFANFVVVSSGTLIAALGLATERATGGAFFYLAHSTLVGGGLFLLADLVARSRAGHGAVSESPPAGAALWVNAHQAQPVLLGTLFLTGAVAVAGLPPLSGFAAKLWLLGGAMDTGAGPVRLAMLVVILGSGVLVLLALARAFSALFWRSSTFDGVPRAKTAALPITQVSVSAALLGASVVLMVAAAPVSHYLEATVAQLDGSAGYVGAVLPGAAR